MTCRRRWRRISGRRLWLISKASRLSFEAIKTGCVLDDPYLWARESGHHETEGRKHRPVAVGVRIIAKEQAGRDTVILFPITSQNPPADILNIEIPEAEKFRAGLDRFMRLWIILHEYNLDVIGDSFYIAPVNPLGTFSKGFFDQVLKLALANLGTASPVNRRA